MTREGYSTSHVVLPGAVRGSHVSTGSRQRGHFTRHRGRGSVRRGGSMIGDPVFSLEKRNDKPEEDGQ